MKENIETHALNEACALPAHVENETGPLGDWLSAHRITNEAYHKENQKHEE